MGVKGGNVVQIFGGGDVTASRPSAVAVVQLKLLVRGVVVINVVKDR